MSEAPKERVYEPDEIDARLKRELPHWRYENGWIRRTFRTSGWKGTLMVINAVGHLAEAAWHHPDIAASYAWVEVKLQNHSAKGITDKDFELARKIEENTMISDSAPLGLIIGFRKPAFSQSAPRMTSIRSATALRSSSLISARGLITWISPSTCVGRAESTKIRSARAIASSTS
jgi:4a-hydroxytetrahydrobiopterin dehydratase